MREIWETVLTFCGIAAVFWVAVAVQSISYDWVLVGIVGAIAYYILRLFP